MLYKNIVNTVSSVMKYVASLEEEKEVLKIGAVNIFSKRNHF